MEGQRKHTISEADAIVSAICNKHRNSDLRADNRDIIAALNDRFEELVKERGLAITSTACRCAEIADGYSREKWRDYKRGEHRADPHYQGLADGAGEVAELIRAEFAKAEGRTEA